MQRRGRAVSDRTRSIAVFSNLFLHIHSVKLHRHSLKPGYTLGLGLLTTAFLVLLTVTGVLLMVYYKPTPELAYNSIKDIHFIVPTGRLMRNLDWVLFLAALMLVLLGLATMKSFGPGGLASPSLGGDYFFTRQIIWVLIGVTVFFVSAVFIDWSFLKTNSIFLLMLYLGLVLILFLLILTGQAVKGASSWLKIGGLISE